jgi:hypothetical protein
MNMEYSAAGNINHKRLTAKTLINGNTKEIIIATNTNITAHIQSPMRVIHNIAGMPTAI